MANKTIPQLPEQTGKTDNDLLAIVDSGETTTSKIKVSTLLAGVGGKYIAADGTNNIVPDYYATSAIDSGSTESAIIAGTGNTIPNSTQYSVIVGSLDSTNNSIRGGIYSSHTSVVNNDTAGVIVGGQSNVTGTGGYYQGVFAGQSNTASGIHTAIFAGSNNETLLSSERSAIIAGQNNDISGDNSVIAGGSSNNITHHRSVILGGSSLSSNYDDEVVCEHLTTSGQSRGNFYNNLSGDTFTIDWDEGNLQKIYMTGDTSLTFSNVKNGATYKLQVENGGTHSITGVTSSGFTILCEGGSIPNITNNGVDLCVLEVMGTDILVRHFANFATP